MASQETKQQHERRAVQTNDYNEHNAHTDESGEKVVAYCDHCGFAIYGTGDALVIKANGDRIHKDCFSEYIEEHMFDFVEKAEETERFDCGF